MFGNEKGKLRDNVEAWVVEGTHADLTLSHSVWRQSKKSPKKKDGK